MLAKINAFLYWLAAKKVSLVPIPWVHLVHASISFLLVSFCSIWPLQWPLYATLPSAALLFGLLELWFDKHYEHQSFDDNLHDFEDYIIGGMGAAILKLKLLACVGAFILPFVTEPTPPPAPQEIVIGKPPVWASMILTPYEK